MPRNSARCFTGLVEITSLQNGIVVTQSSTAEPVGHASHEAPHCSKVRFRSRTDAIIVARTVVCYGSTRSEGFPATWQAHIGWTPACAGPLFPSFLRNTNCSTSLRSSVTRPTSLFGFWLFSFSVFVYYRAFGAGLLLQHCIVYLLPNPILSTIIRA